MFLSIECVLLEMRVWPSGLRTKILTELLERIALLFCFVSFLLFASFSLSTKNQITFETKEPNNKGCSFSLYVNLFGQYLCVCFCGGGRGVRLSVLMTGQGTVKGKRETCKQCGAAHWYVCVCVFDTWYLWLCTL